MSTKDVTIRRLEETLEFKQKEMKQHQMKLESKYEPHLTVTAIKLQKEEEKKKYDGKFFPGMTYLDLIYPL